MRVLGRVIEASGFKRNGLDDLVSKQNLLDIGHHDAVEIEVLSEPQK